MFSEKIKKSFIKLAAAVFAVALFVSPKLGVSAHSASLTVIGLKGVYKFSYPEIAEELGGYRLLKMEEILADICSKESTPPSDAHISFNPNSEKRFKVVKERNGKAADIDKLRDDVLSCLSLGGGSVSVHYYTTYPEIYEKDVSVDNIVKRASFSTSYIGSTAERCRNIAIATSIINGSVLKNGEVFSFNETVGKRSEQKGFKNAKVIVNGKYEEGIGGGICQVSTTLYNAALLSGLKIVSVSPHSLSVGYVANSFDAMVSYGGSDLKFENNTGEDVYIEAYNKAREVCFVIYGKKMNCTYARETVILEKIPFTKKTVFNPLFDENEYVVKQQGKPGIKSQGYLIKIENGVKTRTLIRKDSYKMIEEITESGRKGECLLN